MEELEESLLEWVRSSQINTFHSCKSLHELSDGIILYEQLATISPKYFDKNNLSYKTEGNWLLKHVNLRNLTRSIENYLRNELKTTPPELSVNLVPIARKDCRANTILMLELFLFTLISCPRKDFFIEKIMKLSEDVQRTLMCLIKKAMGEEMEAQPQRHEDLSLKERFMHIQGELLGVYKAKEDLETENEELRDNVKNLQIEVEKLQESADVSKEPSVCIIPDGYLEKEKEISELSHKIKEISRRHEAEIASLNDEIDLANSKLFKMNNNEKKLIEYTKRLEKYNVIKAKHNELIKNNDELTKKLSLEIAEVYHLKAALKDANHQLSVEKNKTCDLDFALKNKETQIIGLNRKILSLKEKDDDSFAKNSAMLGNPEEIFACLQRLGMEHEDLSQSYRSLNAELGNVQKENIELEKMVHDSNQLRIHCEHLEFELKECKEIHARSSLELKVSIQEKQALQEKMTHEILNLENLLVEKDNIIRSLKTSCANSNTDESLQNLNSRLGEASLKTESLRKEEEVQAKIKLAVNQCKKKYKLKIKDMIHQTHNAVNDIQKDKEKLVGKLQSQRRVSRLRSVPNEELVSLKNKIAALTNSNNHLSKNNFELRKVLKEIVSALKNAWGEIKSEAHKMEALII